MDYKDFFNDDLMHRRDAQISKSYLIEANNESHRLQNDSEIKNPNRADDNDETDLHIPAINEDLYDDNDNVLNCS